MFFRSIGVGARQRFSGSSSFAFMGETPEWAAGRQVGGEGASFRMESGGIPERENDSSVGVAPNDKRLGIEVGTRKRTSPP